MSASMYVCNARKFKFCTGFRTHARIHTNLVVLIERLLLAHLHRTHTPPLRHTYSTPPSPHFRRRRRGTRAKGKQLFAACAMPSQKEPLGGTGEAGAQERQQTCANVRHTPRAREACAGAKATARRLEEQREGGGEEGAKASHIKMAERGQNKKRYASNAQIRDSSMCGCKR